MPQQQHWDQISAQDLGDKHLDYSPGDEKQIYFPNEAWPLYCLLKFCLESILSLLYLDSSIKRNQQTLSTIFLLCRKGGISMTWAYHIISIFNEQTHKVEYFSKVLKNKQCMLL